MALKDDLSSLCCAAGGLALTPKTTWSSRACPGPVVPEGRGPSGHTRVTSKDLSAFILWLDGQIKHRTCVYIWPSDKQQIMFLVYVSNIA